MALTSRGFDRAGTVSGLAYGTIFRTEDLPINQLMIKVRGPTKQSSWVLVLGGSGKRVYPSPWYGTMEDVVTSAIWSVQARTTVAALGSPIDQLDGGIVFPGCLVVGPRGRLGVIIEGELCIEPQTGDRFRVDSRTVVAYNQWVIDVFDAQGQTTLMRYTGPAAAYVR